MAGGVLPGNGLISLDPFTDIVAVSWGDLVTKLDFVNHRYKVRGRLQNINEVIDHPEYRVIGQGLDLRGRTGGGVVSPIAPVRTAFLKNKAEEVTRANPGALNEFTFLNSTIVIELDWPSRYAALIAAGNYSETSWEGTMFGPFPENTTHWWVAPFGPGIHPDYFFQSNYVNEVGLAQAIERKLVAAIEDELLPSTEDSDQWVPQTGFPLALTENSVEGGNVGFEWVNPLTGAHLWVHPYDAVGDGPVWYLWLHQAFYKYGTGRLTAGPYPASGIDTLSSFYSVDNPRSGDLPYGVSQILIDNQPDEDDWIFRPTNQIVAYSTPDAFTTFGQIAPDGAAYDSADFGEFYNGRVTAHERIRIAINFRSDRIDFAVNGSDVISLEANAGFAFPRVPPSGRKYFKASDGAVFGMSGYFIYRCIWLYRTQKRRADLKKLSVVRTLPAANSPLWDTQ